MGWACTSPSTRCSPVQLCVCGVGRAHVRREQDAINAPRTPRHYVFKHVATRTASNFITSENLWGSASRVRAHSPCPLTRSTTARTQTSPPVAPTPQEPYAGPPRGLHSPRDKPYLCNGAPDLVLSSLNHVRARKRVAAQIATKRNEDAVRGTLR